MSSATAAPPRCLLRIEHVSKRFGAQVALANVALVIRPGEVHGLAGHNGSGKSTLIKTLAGYHEPEPGARLELSGRRFIWEQAPHGWRDRLRFVHQDLALAPNLNAMENFALGGRYRRGRYLRGRGPLIDWREQERAVAQALEALGLAIDVRVPVARLSMVERTMIAIARAFRSLPGHGILVLDEPTAALTKHEVDRLFDMIRRATAHGAGVLLVTHYLDELLTLSDSVTVLRNGRVSMAAARAEISAPLLAEAIAGTSELTNHERTRTDSSRSAQVRLQVRGLAAARLAPLTFDLRAGEILGVAGLSGSGRDEIAELLSGYRKPAAGEVWLDGEQVRPGHIRVALAHGIGLVPANRHEHGLFRRHSAGENVTLPRLSEFAKALRVDRIAERDAATRALRRANVVPLIPERPVMLFSGGNQQKTVLARWLHKSPKLLLLDEPTQGVDVGARTAIWALIGDIAATGTSFLVCSSDNEELAELCDRVLVLVRGEVVREMTGPQLTERAITHACLGELTDGPVS